MFNAKKTMTWLSNLWITWRANLSDIAVQFQCLVMLAMLSFLIDVKCSSVLNILCIFILQKLSFVSDLILYCGKLIYSILKGHLSLS